MNATSPEPMTEAKRDWAWPGYLMAVVGGGGIWVASAMLSGQREAWDAPMYWTFGYPLSIALAGGLGYWFPRRAWRWGLAVLWSQALVMVVAGEGSRSGLLPLGLVMFGVLSLPAIGLAMLAGWIRLRIARG